MDVTRDDAYEDMGASWQCLEISRLDSILRDEGITDARLRARIVSTYVAGVGDVLDQGWLISNGKLVYPHVCFSEKLLQPDTDPRNLGRVFFPSKFFSYLEYASGNWRLHYEENRDAANEVKHGLIGDEPKSSGKRRPKRRS